MAIRGRPLPLPELFLGLLSIGVAVVLTAKIVAGTIHDARHIHAIGVIGSFPPAPPGSSNGPPRSSSLPSPRLDSTRAELAERTIVPLLLVRGGLRPSGLAPEQTLTRFSRSLADS